MVLATLALSATTTTLDLATALRRLLAPLRLLRVPVGSLAFVTATGIGMVPAMSDELECLRTAQRARGLRHADASLLRRLRADAAAVGPLFVAAFRRAHLLADALAVRGIDPRTPPAPWRRAHVPTTDVLLLGAGMLALAVARLADHMPGPRTTPTTEHHALLHVEYDGTPSTAGRASRRHADDRG